MNAMKSQKITKKTESTSSTEIYIVGDLKDKGELKYYPRT